MWLTNWPTLIRSHHIDRHHQFIEVKLHTDVFALGNKIFSIDADIHVILNIWNSNLLLFFFIQNHHKANDCDEPVISPHRIQRAWRLRAK